MNKLLILTILLLTGISAVSQKAITFDSPNGKLFFTEQINGQNVTRNFPTASCYYIYEPSVNRISIYFTSSLVTTIYSGAFANISVSGKITTAEKLAELNTKLTAGESLSVNGSTGSESGVAITYTLTTKTAHNGETSTSYSIPATAIFWVVCNVGSNNATITDESSSEVITLRIGQCINDEIKYTSGSNIAVRVSPISINASGTICTYRWK